MELVYNRSFTLTAGCRRKSKSSKKTASLTAQFYPHSFSMLTPMTFLQKHYDFMSMIWPFSTSSCEMALIGKYAKPRHGNNIILEIKAQHSKTCANSLPLEQQESQA